MRNWGFLRMDLVAEKESENNNNENHNSYADDEFRGSQARELRAGLDPVKVICFLLFVNSDLFAYVYIS